jgi:Pentapeptide repeats (8 copies)
MLKRWADWPRGVRWLVGIAIVVLALAIVWVLFVPASDWLARHDVGSVKGPLHETALDNARGRLLTLAAGLFAVGALLFTARNFTLSRRTVELSRRTFALTEQGQVTDRYTKAIEQLGSDKLDVRIGGIYALERVARDSARDHPTVMEVLTAFIREHSREPWPPPDSGSQERERSTRPDVQEARPDVQAAVTVIGRREARPDVQAAVTVIGRREAKRDIRHIDLSDADLRRATLVGAYLSGANLIGADLTGAHLSGADLTGASLTSAGLSGAHLADADLSGAHLSGAVLKRARLSTWVYSSAYLAGASLTGADLGGADLTGADLTGADLTGADLTDAQWPRDAPVPEGWKLKTNSDRLERAATDSGPTEAN